jgi:formylmethanofuran dehydrogenase subunit E
MAAATDYDAPRRNQTEESDEDSLEALKARRSDKQSGAVDVDETDLNEALELPGADLSNMSEEELTVRVLPKQADEFTCSRCFLVHHRSRLGRETRGQMVCRDCA